MSNSKIKSAKSNKDMHDIFDEIERELPDDLSDLMYEGKSINAHGRSRSYLDDDGRY